MLELLKVELQVFLVLLQLSGSLSELLQSSNFVYISSNSQFDIILLLMLPARFWSSLILVAKRM
jgi:hypothetical protein